MYKAVLLLIILGLSIPLLHAKSTTGKGLKKTQKNIANNAEEALDGTDFWDFDPHADVEKASQPNPTDTNDITPFKESKKSNKGPKGTFDELEQIVKDIELTIASLDKRNEPKTVHFDRMLQLEVPNVANPPIQNVEQSPAITLNQEENGETIVNEEDDNVEEGETGPFPGEEEEEEEDNGETGPLPGEEEEEEDSGETGPLPGEEEEEEDSGETGPLPGEEEEEDNNGQPEEEQEEEPQEEEQTEQPPQEEEEEEQDDGITIPDPTLAEKRGMGTVTLSGSIEYDTDFDNYDKVNGRKTFVNSLASVLDMDTSSVRVTNIRRGSVIFDFEITSEVPSSMLKDTVVSNIEALDKKITDATRDGSLNLPGAPVMSYKRQILVFSPAEETNEPKGMGWIVAMAAVLSFVILSLIGWLLYQQKKLGSLNGEKKIKYQLPSEQEGRADWESGQHNMSQAVNQSDSIRFYPVSPPNVFTYDGRDGQPKSPSGISPAKLKAN